MSTIRRGIWFPLAVLTVHAIVTSLCGNLYHRHAWLDIPMHFFGGTAIAAFFAVLIHELERRQLAHIHSPLAASLLIAALTSLAALGWEYAEWSSDLLLGTHTQVSLNDTMLDTLLGLLGGLLYLCATRLPTVAAELCGRPPPSSHTS